jgi:hypothetical protein
MRLRLRLRRELRLPQRQPRTPAGRAGGANEGRAHRGYAPRRRAGGMNVFNHHVYEYRKGVRRLVLHTTAKAYQAAIEAALRRKKISYLLYPLGAGKINVFFGDAACIEVIKAFNKHNLFELTDEEDFILGIMLGYDTAKQCERYLGRTARNATSGSRMHAA